MEIPYSKVSLDHEEEEAVTRVLRSGWLAAGKETKAFEEEFAAYVGVRHAIFTSSCTSALKMAYKWAEEQKISGWVGEDGTRAIMEPNTFCATYSAASESGIEYRFAEEGELPGYGEFRVSMHYGGVKDETPCLIEDSAHRIEPNDPLVGKIRCYSFYATKDMTTGSGGMFVTNDDAIYERARLYWRDGLTTSTLDRSNGFGGYEVKAMAGGYDGNDIAAAIGRVQLRKLPQFSARRRDIRDSYNAGLGQSWDGYHLYPIMVKDEKEVYECIAFMKSRGIGCSHNYPGTGWNGVSLPIYPLLTDEEVSYVIANALEWRATHKT